MVRAWLVRLELARDDGGALGEDVINELTRLLTEDGGLPVLSGGEAGPIAVQLRVEARDDQAASAAAEKLLRDRAHEVWAAMGLPPFTIAFVGAMQADPGR